MIASEIVTPLLDRRAATLEATFGHLDAAAVLRYAVTTLFPGQIALTSSFGADSAVLLHMLSTVDRAVPVLFLDTGKLFPETLTYRDRLVGRFGLRNVRSVTPLQTTLEAEDPDDFLWSSDPDRCCAVRKVAPLAFAIEGFAAWLTGRKRAHGGLRAHLAVFEAEGFHVKINPLAAWSPADVEAYLSAHDIPAHPLVAKGFRSIGCLPCTSHVRQGENARAGRWRGQGKSECGIHIAEAMSVALAPAVK